MIVGSCQQWGGRAGGAGRGTFYEILTGAMDLAIRLLPRQQITGQGP